MAAAAAAAGVARREDGFFVGSIADAIAAAKAKQLMLVVVVQGHDETSLRMEQIWRNPEVAAFLSSNAVALKLAEGSTEAGQFQAIYPLQAIPAAAIINFNGAQLNLLTGFISAEALLSALSTAKRSLDEQVAKAAAAAAVLAYMASNNHQRPPAAAAAHTAGVATTSTPSPSSTTTPSRTPRTASGPPVRTPPTAAAHASTTPKQSSTSVAATNRGLHEKGKQAVKETRSEAASKPSTEAVQAKPPEPIRPSKPMVAQIQVRLTDGSSLRSEFAPDALLRDVRTYIDMTRTDGGAKYSLLSPYPRRTFVESDYNRALSELELTPSATLILAPQAATGDDSQASSSARAATPSAASPTGSGLLGGVLSYFNPLGYFKQGDSAAPATTSATAHASPPSTPPDDETQRASAWEYEPDQQLETKLRRQQQPPQQPQVRDGLTRRAGRGGNIHTLSHAVDDDPSRNMYYNGNSTQFGGDKD
eukprot:jgi/Chlat1/8310/Chrsp78S07723